MIFWFLVGIDWDKFIFKTSSIMNLYLVYISGYHKTKILEVMVVLLRVTLFDLFHFAVRTWTSMNLYLLHDCLCDWNNSINACSVIFFRHWLNAFMNYFLKPLCPQKRSLNYKSIFVAIFWESNMVIKMLTKKGKNNIKNNSFYFEECNASFLGTG